MKVLIRTDASLEIGTGHVVRCASLAEGLRAAGHHVHFLCRDTPGNLIGWLRDRSFTVSAMLSDESTEEAGATRAALRALESDWLIVDHYGLDIAWERAVRNDAGMLLAIDDLGRPHLCDMLLDQNYASPLHAQYEGNVPADCEMLFGPEFALIRREFFEARAGSIRRQRGEIKTILIFMSGIDMENETGKALTGIALSKYRTSVIDVVIGEGNPHRASVEDVCSQLQNAHLHVQTSRMADLMAAADLIFCAGGSVNWERCTLGLPGMITILAENQRHVAEALYKAGASQTLGWYGSLVSDDYCAAIDALDSASVSAMSEASAAICDGDGVNRVIDRLINRSSHERTGDFG